MEINLKRLLMPYVFDVASTGKRDSRLYRIGNVIYFSTAVLSAACVALVQSDRGILPAVASAAVVLMLFSFGGVMIQAIKIKKRQGRPGGIYASSLKDAFADRKVYQRFVQAISNDEGGWDTNQAKALVDAVYTSKMVKDGMNNEKRLAHLIYEQFEDKFAGAYNPNSIMNARKTTPYDDKWKKVVTECLKKPADDRND